MKKRTQILVVASLLAACKARTTSDDAGVSPPGTASASASVDAPVASAPAASVTPSAEPSTAPYLPTPEPLPEVPAPRKTIGSFDDWVKAYEGLGAPEAHKKPPRLRLAKDLAIKSGRIAFGRSNDIFVFDLAKLEEKQLTRKAQRNIDPVFLADGARVAFLSNRDGMAWRVFVMNADGSGQRAISRKFPVAYDASFAISRDGARVAYVAATGKPSGEPPEQLHLVDTASGEDTPIGDPDYLGDYAFSPKGDQLYYVAGGFDSEHVAVVDLASKRVRHLPTAGYHMFHAPQLLGDRLFFTASESAAYCCRRSYFFTIGLDGTGIQALGTFWVSGSMYPRVSPKGSKIAAESSVREGGFGADWRNEISLFDAKGRGERPLSDAFPRPFYSAFDPTWAPDDRHLAFTLSLCPYVGCEPTIRSVVVVDTADPKAVPAFIAYGGKASWSPVP